MQHPHTKHNHELLLHAIQHSWSVIRVWSWLSGVEPESKFSDSGYLWCRDSRCIRDW